VSSISHDILDDQRLFVGTSKGSRSPALLETLIIACPRCPGQNFCLGHLLFVAV